MSRIYNRKGMASRRKEEPRPRDSEIPPYLWIGSASFITQRANAAIRASEHRMMIKGIIKIYPTKQ